MKKKGQDLAEWGLILALVSVISAVTLSTIGDNLKVITETLQFRLDQTNQLSAQNS